MQGHEKFHLRRELLEQLVRTGSPVDMQVANDIEARALEIEPGGGAFNQILELENGGFALIAYVWVTNRMARAIQVVDAYLRSEIGDGSFEWLTPLEIKSSRSKKETQCNIYRFPGLGAPEFPYYDSLNRHLFSGGLLQGKRCYEGWLLGVGGLMPSRLKDGCWLDVPLVIVTADRSEYTVDLHLLTERRAVRPKFAKRQRSGLFEPVSRIESAISLKHGSTVASPSVSADRKLDDEYDPSE